MIGLRFDQNTWNWIDDRIMNEEPLWWNDFIKFMDEIGVSDKKLALYKNKRYRAKVRRVYLDMKRRIPRY